jgi:hypothetical protein
MHHKKNRNAKAQVWLSDYTISLLIFLLAIILSFKIIINSFSTNNTYEELKTDAGKISEMLLSEGYPVDWNESSVIRPGLLVEKRLDATKVARAMNQNMSYSSLKTKLQTKYDFLVMFKTPEGDLIDFDSSCGSCASSCGLCHIGKALPANYDDLVKLDRFVVFNSSVTRMEVYVWRE